MAALIDDNEADEKSGKSMCQLINIHCTSIRADEDISLWLPVPRGYVSLIY